MDGFPGGLGRKKGMDREAVLAGAWRWRRTPPKMRGG